MDQIIKLIADTIPAPVEERDKEKKDKEISKYPLIIRRNWHLYQQLAKDTTNIVKPPTLPQNETERKKAQERWTQLPSPISTTPTTTTPISQKLKTLMKPLSFYGFKPVKNNVGQVQKRRGSCPVISLSSYPTTDDSKSLSTSTVPKSAPPCLPKNSPKFEYQSSLIAKWIQQENSGKDGDATTSTLPTPSPKQKSLFDFFKDPDSVSISSDASTVSATEDCENVKVNNESRDALWTLAMDIRKEITKQVQRFHDVISLYDSELLDNPSPSTLQLVNELTSNKICNCTNDNDGKITANEHIQFCDFSEETTIDLRNETTQAPQEDHTYEMSSNMELIGLDSYSDDAVFHMLDTLTPSIPENSQLTFLNFQKNEDGF